MTMRRVANFSSCLSGEDPRLEELSYELTELVEKFQGFNLESFVEKHPLYADELRRLYPAIRAMVNLAGEQGETPTELGMHKEGVAVCLGDYRLVRQVGQGGMGVVFEAEQMSLFRTVAVKILPFASLWPESVLARFANEVRMAASLEHPNIVPIYGVGCERGVNFYAMKLIDGCSLADVIRRRESFASSSQPSAKENLQLDAGTTKSLELLPTQAISQTTPYAGQDSSVPNSTNAQPSTSDAARIDAVVTEVIGNDDWHRAAAKLALSAAEALAYAHERGVIHRDIKPSNLLLDSQGKLFVADFGLARGETDINLTRTGELLGTPRYMSPEQAAGRQGAIDTRTDIYALGATLYELITLQPVIRAVHRAEALRELQDLQVIPPRQHDAHIPQPLEQIVLKCLQPDPRDRYRSANDLADDLRRFLDGRAVVAGSPGWVRRASRYVHAHPRTALGVVAVLALCVLIPGIFWFADGGHPSLTSRGPPAESGLKDSTATGHPLTKNSSLESPDMLRSSLNKNQNTQDRSRAQRRLLVEALEDRKLLAVLAADGFESANFNGGSGWIGAGWQVAGDATVLSSNSPHAGLYQARLRASSGDLIRAVDVTGQTDLRLQFWSKVSSFESLDKAVVRVSSDGIVWNQVQQFGSAQSDNQYHFYDIPINNPSNTLYVGFSAGMSASNDQWYLDDIAVTGVPIGPPQISISDATASEGGMNWTFVESFESEAQVVPYQTWDVTRSDAGDYYATTEGGGELSGIMRIDGQTGEVDPDFVPLGTAGLSKAREITIHGDWIYVANKTTDEVLRFDLATGDPDPAGAFVNSGDHGLVTPRGITFDDNGNLLVISKGTNEILKYDSQGDFLGVFASGITSTLAPNDLTLDAAGNVYVTGDAKVYSYASDGTFLGVFADAGSAMTTAVEFGPDGDLYVADGPEGNVLRFDGQNGNLIDVVIGSSFGEKQGMAFDGAGSLFVANHPGNTYSARVLRYASSSAAAFTVNLSAPSADPITVVYSTSNDTATAGSDYVATSGTLIFEPGVTSRTIIVPTIDDSELEGDETFYVNLTSAVGGEIVDEQGVGTIVDNEVPPQVSVSAVSESSIYGSVNGSYHATQAADGVVQTLTEERYSSNRRTRLEHRWRFDNVTSGDSVELLVVAYQTNSNPVETFALSYSTDNANWTNLGNLGPSSYPLPNTLSGTVYIRVVDTDRSNNERTLDVLAVDQLLIRTTTAPANLSSPLAPPPSSFATTSSFDQLSTEEEYQPSWSLISKPAFVARGPKQQLAQLAVVSHPMADSVPARSAGTDSDASPVDEVFGQWDSDSSPLIDIAAFGL
jgi:serine/threonine protein kinase